MYENIGVISEQIDELLLRKLDLMEDKIRKNIQMETFLKNGHIELAKAKYIRGKESISISQIPNNEVLKSLFDVETKVLKEDYGTVPCFDISLKKSNEMNEPGNPIKWFGVLVPQNLRNSQKYFQEAIYLSAKIANIQMELIYILSRLKTLYMEKSNLNCSDNTKTE